MMDFELRAKKIQKESELRLQEAKRKKEREMKLQLEQKQREQKMAEIAEQNRLKLLAEEEERLEKERLRYLKTGGVNFRLDNLIPYAIDGEDDKVILPESSLSALDRQNALSSGPLFFEISCTTSASSSNLNIDSSLLSNTTTNMSHCGVREFSATEGTIGLPPKVLHSMLKSLDGSINDILSVSVSYTRLPKISNAKFAPVVSKSSESIFQVGPIKQVLEENLRSHSTLSVGDRVSVWHRGRCYQLCVVELQPETSGSLIDADVEVEFTSLEQSSDTAETKTTPSTAPENPSSNNRNSNSSHTSSGGVVGGSVGYRLSDSTPQASTTTSTSAAPKSTAPMESFDLSPEPDAAVSDTEVVQMRVRLPQGAPLNRRFFRNQRLVDLFYFICHSLHTAPSQLQITLPSKNRTITWSELDPQLHESGFKLSDNGMISSDELNQGNNSNNITFESVGLLSREMAIVSIVSH